MDNEITTNTDTDNTVVAPVVADKPRKSPDLKAKSVIFTLTKEMRLADLTEAGYQRKEVLQLFGELQSAGWGVFTEGRLGRGCSAKFDCNDDAPATHTIVTMVRRLRKDYVGRVAVADAVVPATVVVAEGTVILADDEEDPIDELPVIEAVSEQVVVAENLA